MCVSFGFIGFLLTAIGTLTISLRQISWFSGWISQQIWTYLVEDEHAVGVNAVLDIRENGDVVSRGEGGFEELVNILQERKPIFMPDMPPAGETHRIDVVTDRREKRVVRVATDTGIRVVAGAGELDRLVDDRLSSLSNKYQDWSRYPFYAVLLLGVNLQGAAYVWPSVAWCPIKWFTFVV